MHVNETISVFVFIFDVKSCEDREKEQEVDHLRYFGSSWIICIILDHSMIGVRVCGMWEVCFLFFYFFGIAEMERMSCR